MASCKQYWLSCDCYCLLEEYLIHCWTSWLAVVDLFIIWLLLTVMSTFFDQELIPHRYSCCCSCSSSRLDDAVQKSPKVSAFQIGSGCNLAVLSKQIRIDWRSRIFELTSHFQDGGHDVISRGKVLPSGELTRRVRSAHMQQRPPAAH